MAWTIAAGLMSVAPRAAAGEGEVAPRTEATRSPSPAPAPSQSEVAPQTEVAPRTEVEATTADEPPRRTRREPEISAPDELAESRLSRYLQRPVRFGAHYLDHGVLQPAIAGGWPHGYRLELALGLLDHLTLGVTAHWLPSESKPRVSPIVALAILRGRLYEIGLWHFWSLYPPPRADADPLTASYQRSAQWFLATGSFGQAWLTGGLDAGVVRARVNDPSQDPAIDTSNPSVIRWRFGGGLHLRAGTRRWGFTAQVLVPHFLAELRFDVRFGLFEKRSRGGWRPYGKAEDWDRPRPW